MKIWIRNTGGEWKEYDGTQVGVYADDGSPLAGITQKSPEAYMAAMAGEVDFAKVMQAFPGAGVGEVVRVNVEDLTTVTEGVG